VIAALGRTYVQACIIIRPASEIRILGERRGRDLHVEVSDQGIGLRKDFDLDQPRASLGFKVIKSLVGQLDGRIYVSASEQQKGATIRLDVPLDADPS
jgi:two-component sensor histidine kinase